MAIEAQNSMDRFVPRDDNGLGVDVPLVMASEAQNSMAASCLAMTMRRVLTSHLSWRAKRGHPCLQPKSFFTD
ncbi:hypothetical protein B9Z50_04135 [Limnohabitans sp. Bal53]|jgi:hypothetical protein|nr:hypothetical protein B9Z50_04135 [Limnohabitans sp. Bal53]